VIVTIVIVILGLLGSFAAGVLFETQDPRREGAALRVAAASVVLLVLTTALSVYDLTTTP
jgi:hypothetical protein